MESLWSSLLGFYGSLVCIFLAFVVIGFPSRKETIDAQTSFDHKWHKWVLSAFIFLLSAWLVANTGSIKEDRVRQSRFSQLCLEAAVDIRNVAKEVNGIYTDGLLSFSKGQAPEYTDFDCDARSGLIPFLIRPATKDELRNNDNPFRKISYAPIGDGAGRCADPNQKQVIEAAASNSARYSVVRNQSPLLSIDDKKLGIKGDIVEVRDNLTQETLALIKYFYIRKEFRVCPSRNDTFPAAAIVKGVLGAHPSAEKIMSQWRH